MRQSTQWKDLPCVQNHLWHIRKETTWCNLKKKKASGSQLSFSILSVIRTFELVNVGFIHTCSLLLTAEGFLKASEELLGVILFKGDSESFSVPAFWYLTRWRPCFSFSSSLLPAYFVTKRCIFVSRQLVWFVLWCCNSSLCDALNLNYPNKQTWKRGAPLFLFLLQTFKGTNQPNTPLNNSFSHMHVIALLHCCQHCEKPSLDVAC